MGELKRRGQIWWIRYYKNGRRYEESSGSTKEAAAKGLLRLREGDIERGVAMTPKVGRIRFEEASKDVLNDYRTNRKRSLDDVERRIELHLKPFFGNRRMASITTADIREYIDSRQKETTVLRKAFTFTARDGTPRQVPEQRRTITGVSNAEINREDRLPARFPPLGPADQELPRRIPDGLCGSRVSRARPARLPQNGGPQSRPRRYSRARGDADDRAQDPERVRAIQYRERWRPS